MLRELGLAIVLQRVRDPGSSIGPRLAIRLATLGSAAVLGWDDAVGSLEVGKAADIVLYDLRHPWGLTAERVESEIVYAADRDSVRSVFVGGRPVLTDGQLRTVDEEAMWSELAARYQAEGARDWDGR